MFESEILRELQNIKAELDSKSRRADRAIIIQTAILVVTTISGAAWTAMNYWHQTEERKAIPAKIEVQTKLEDLGIHHDQRFIRADITVENKGSVRAHVIYDTFAISAKVMQLGPPAPSRANGNAWDSDWSNDTEIRTLRSGVLFGREYWFEPGERNARSVIVAIPEQRFDTVTVLARVRHAKRINDAVRTKWSWNAQHALEATLFVRKKIGPCEASPDACEEYNRKNHRKLYEREGIALNDSFTELPLWATKSTNAAR